MSEHKHVWAKTGCYCGARCCESFGYSDGTTIAKGPGMLSTGGRIYFCDQPAVDGNLCQFHAIAERYLLTGRTITIAHVNMEIERLKETV